jgi:hypothetical protein
MTERTRDLCDVAETTGDIARAGAYALQPYAARS